MEQTSTLPITVFQRLAAVIIRNHSGDLLHCLGPFHEAVKSVWGIIQSQLEHAPQEDITHVKFESHHVNLPILNHLCIFERALPSGDIIGILFQSSDESRHLDSFLCALILNSINIDIEHREQHHDQLSERHQERISNAVVDHFDQTLRYSSYHDEWKVRGRDYFLGQVRHFISKGQRIEFCLPAFPCKSSNPNKVLGVQPDRGEFIALTNLNQFVQGIETIYKPGAKLWIISDGHVFSDCIGVDDDVVDTYGAQLIRMNEQITQIQGGKERIGFKSLVDIFALGPSHDWSSQTLSKSQIPPITHHIATKLEGEAELCRRILMMGFEANGEDLRRRIESKEASILALYRGFSRFMLEDLDENVYTKDMSRTQRRKLSSKVAFEMIQRNQAYSNLVEIVFPHHVRLSIHAHPNSGPKFGIQMFGTGVRATNLLSANGSLMESSDLLHIPTPWHNCMVEIQGHKKLYVTKSSIVKFAISNGELQGGPAGSPDVEGQYFHLTALPAKDCEAGKTGSAEVKDQKEDTSKSSVKSLPNKRVLVKEKSRATAGPSLTQRLRHLLGNFWEYMR